MSFTQLLLQARNKKAEEFIFVVGSEPRMRMNSGWVSMRNSPGLISEWTTFQQTVLNENQRTLLDTLGFAQGEVSIEGYRFGFSVFQNDQTMKVFFNLDLDGGAKEIQVPPSILEVCLRMKGLVLLSSSGEAGQVWALHKVLQKMSETKSFLGVVLSKRPFPQVKEQIGHFLYHTGYFTKDGERESFFSGVDVVVFEDFDDDHTFEKAMSFAERGMFVIYSMRAPSVINSLRRLLGVLKEKYSDHGASRLAEVLSMAAGQYGAEGIGGDKVYAHEILLAKPQVRTMIEGGDIRSIEALLKNAAENSGILTLNQSLLQLLIRRRLDLKKAFEISRDPENLDQLLKKVGI